MSYFKSDSQSIVVLQVKEEDLREFADKLIREAKSLNPPNNKPTASRIVDLDTFCKEYKHAKPTIYAKLSKKDFPGASKIGKKWFIDLDVYEEYVRSKRVKTVSEIEEEAENFLESKRKKRQHGK